MLEADSRAGTYAYALADAHAHPRAIPATAATTTAATATAAASAFLLLLPALAVRGHGAGATNCEHSAASERAHSGGRRSQALVAVQRTGLRGWGDKFRPIQGRFFRPSHGAEIRTNRDE